MLLLLHRSIFTENLEQFRRLAEALATDADAVATTNPRQEATDGAMVVGLSSVLGEPQEEQQEWEDVNVEEEEGEEEGEEEEVSLPEERAKFSSGALQGDFWFGVCEQLRGGGSLKVALKGGGEACSSNPPVSLGHNPV